MGQTIIILNDLQLAFEILEKRSVTHSSRPRQIFGGEMYVCHLRGNVQCC